MSAMKIVAMGFCVYLCPPLFLLLARRWAPDQYVGDNAEQHELTARTLRRRFWKGVALTASTIGAVLVVQRWGFDGLNLSSEDWLRVAAVFIVLSATLGRAGWSIQSRKGNNVVERIDRSMYLVTQLGAAALLVFVLTL